jgi:hypothetical protein
MTVYSEQVSSYVVEDWPRGRILIPKGPWSTEAAEALRDPRIDGLSISYADGSAQSDLEFFEAWPIKVLVIQDRSLTDLRPIERLAGTLEDLFVEAADEGAVDLAEFARLRKLSGDWVHFADTASRAEGLREVLFWPYDGVDLEPLGDSVRLERITLKEADSLLTLSGVERLPSLRELWVVATHLEDISDLRLVRSPLEKLQLEDAILIETLNDLVELEQLRWLEINDLPEIACALWRPYATLRSSTPWAQPASATKISHLLRVSPSSTKYGCATDLATARRWRKSREYSLVPPSKGQLTMSIGVWACPTLKGFKTMFTLRLGGTRG